MVVQPIPFQAAIDDSGSEPQSPVYVLAGFIGPYAKWASFADEWQATLDQPPKLDYFKMAEAAHLGGQFSKRKGWTETKRDDRIVTLARLIRKYAQVRITAWIRHDDYNTHIKPLPTPVRRLVQDSPYVMLFQQIILSAAVFGDRHGIVEPCDFIFDTQGAFSTEAMQWWPHFKRTVQLSSKSDLAKFVGDPPIFRDEKAFLPLQAADLYAWQVRNHYVENHRVPNQTLVVPMNRILQMLNPIPAINREFSTAEVIRLREHLLKAKDDYVRAFPDIPLLGPVQGKRERRRAHSAARKATAKASRASKEKPA